MKSILLGIVIVSLLQFFAIEISQADSGTSVPQPLRPPATQRSNASDESRRERITGKGQVVNPAFNKEDAMGAARLKAENDLLGKVVSFLEEHSYVEKGVLIDRVIRLCTEGAISGVQVDSATYDPVTGKALVTVSTRLDRIAIPEILQCIDKFDQ